VRSNSGSPTVSFSASANMTRTASHFAIFDLGHFASYENTLVVVGGSTKNVGTDVIDVNEYTTCLVGESLVDGQCSKATCAEGFGPPNSCNTSCPTALKCDGGCNSKKAGVCSEQKSASFAGKCVCNSGFEGAGCNECVDPRYKAPRCEDCSDLYYGQKCTKECPGVVTIAATNVSYACAGHGTCSSGTLGTGTCTCEGNWGTASCGSCINHYDTATGCTNCSAGWDTIKKCTTCLPNYAPPTGSPLQCDACVANYDITTQCTKCKPNFDLTTGCEQCLDGYYGSDCLKTCPGGAGTAQCEGHGKCDDGISGTGTCSCGLGYEGTECNKCTAGFYCSKDRSTTTPYASYPVACSGGAASGATCEACACEKVCPLANQCGGHGACQTGNTCSCNSGNNMHWDSSPGVDCTDCQGTYWGSLCNETCPGGAGALACGGSSHGSCDDKIRGNGSCFCTGTWAGEDCLTAPASSSEGGLGLIAIILIIVGSVALVAIICAGAIYAYKMQTNNPADRSKYAGRAAVRARTAKQPLLENEAESAANAGGDAEGADPDFIMM